MNNRFTPRRLQQNENSRTYFCDDNLKQMLNFTICRYCGTTLAGSSVTIYNSTVTTIRLLTDHTVTSTGFNLRYILTCPTGKLQRNTKHLSMSNLGVQDVHYQMSNSYLRIDNTTERPISGTPVYPYLIHYFYKENYLPYYGHEAH